MKLVSVTEVRNNFLQYLKHTKKEDVVIVRSGKPMAVLQRLGQDELEDYLLEHDPKFKAELERRSRYFLKHGGLTLEEMRKRIGAGRNSKKRIQKSR